MILYLASWVRGPSGSRASEDDIASNKMYASHAAARLRTALEPFHQVVCPHEDGLLGKIDDLWLETRSEHLVHLAVQRCTSLLDACDGLVAITRGYVSAGMQLEIEYAKRFGKFVYETEELTDESLEDLVMALIEYEGNRDGKTANQA
ncbi:MAG TPA: hypothetical protein PLR31_11555 [Anaerohalosphaeraceae bacterium]|nr:hypothetical protein [Anaerohalosphaeraceae bacterium]